MGGAAHSESKDEILGERPMYKFCCCVAICAMTAACASTRSNAPAEALDAAQAEAVPVETVRTPLPTADDADALVCTDIATIGTRLTRRVCKTRAQIDMEREAAQKMTNTRGMSEHQSPSAHVAPPRAIGRPSH
jgi:hypothetical protein